MIGVEAPARRTAPPDHAGVGAAVAPRPTHRDDFHEFPLFLRGGGSDPPALSETQVMRRRSSGGAAAVRADRRSPGARCPAPASPFEPNDSADPELQGDVRAVARSPGTPLTAGARRWLEASFGVDLGTVRIHTDAAAAASARARQAAGYAFDDHVVLDESRCEANMLMRLHLLAHEVAHVVQHRRAEPAGGGTAASSAEADANAAAAAALAGRSARSTSSRPAARIQRQVAMTFEEVVNAIARGGAPGTPDYLVYVADWWRDSGQIGSRPPHGYLASNGHVFFYSPRMEAPPRQMPPPPADWDHLRRAELRRAQYARTSSAERAATLSIRAIDDTRVSPSGVRSGVPQPVAPRTPTPPDGGGGGSGGGGGGGVDPFGRTQLAPTLVQDRPPPRAVGEARGGTTAGAVPPAGRPTLAGSAPFSSGRGLTSAVLRGLPIASEAWELYQLGRQAQEIVGQVRQIEGRRAAQFAELHEEMAVAEGGTPPSARDAEPSAAGRPGGDLSAAIGSTVTTALVRTFDPSGWEVLRCSRPLVLTLFGQSLWARLRPAIERGGDAALNAVAGPIAGLDVPPQTLQALADAINEAAGVRADDPRHFMSASKLSRMTPISLLRHLQRLGWVYISRD